MSRVKVKSLEHLKEILKDGNANFVLLLNGGLRSSKYSGLIQILIR